MPIISIEKSSSSTNLYSKHIQRRVTDFIATNNNNCVFTQQLVSYMYVCR